MVINQFPIYNILRMQVWSRTAVANNQNIYLEREEIGQHKDTFAVAMYIVHFRSPKASTPNPASEELVYTDGVLEAEKKRQV